jgi:hypothetical protein
LTPFPLTFFRLRFSFTESILIFFQQLVTACSTSVYLTQAISFSPLFLKKHTMSILTSIVITTLLVQSSLAAPVKRSDHKDYSPSYKYDNKDHDKSKYDNKYYDKYDDKYYGKYDDKYRWEHQPKFLCQAPPKDAPWYGEYHKWAYGSYPPNYKPEHYKPSYKPADYKYDSKDDYKYDYKYDYKNEYKYGDDYKYDYKKGDDYKKGHEYKDEYKGGKDEATPTVVDVPPEVTESFFDPLPFDSEVPATTQITDPLLDPAVTQVTDPLLDPVVSSDAPAATQVTDPLLDPVVSADEPAVTQVTDPLLDPVLSSAAPAPTQITDPALNPARR